MFAMPGIGHAQDLLSPEDQLMSAGRYLPRYLELRAAAEAAPDNMQAASTFAQYAAFVGADDFPSPGSPESPQLPGFDSLSAEPALSALERAARDVRVVVLNEAHHVPAHRHFLGRVLERLRPLGYDRLGAEAFFPVQPEPTPRVESYAEGMPWLPAYGFYTRDPVFAETLRLAASLGYRSFAYEQTEEQSAPPDADRLKRASVREMAQAQNIRQAIQDLSDDHRVIIYCGYEHVTETARGSVTWMAQNLSALLGENILTIDQSLSWSPVASPARDANVVRVMAEVQPAESLVIWADGKPASPLYGDHVDMAVFHPASARIEGRPDWWLSDPSRRRVPFLVPPIDEPTLVQAFPGGEGLGAVPADQVLLRPNQANGLLCLRPGFYLVQRESSGGTVLLGSVTADD